MLVLAFNLSTQEAKLEGPRDRRPAWSLQHLLGQPGQHKETHLRGTAGEMAQFKSHLKLSV